MLLFWKVCHVESLKFIKARVCVKSRRDRREKLTFLLLTHLSFNLLTLLKIFVKIFRFNYVGRFFWRENSCYRKRRRSSICQTRRRKAYRRRFCVISKRKSKNYIAYLNNTIQTTINFAFIPVKSLKNIFSKDFY